MAVRELTDEAGVAWRVWDVVPGRISATVPSELASSHGEGWLACESDAGERRRLRAPYPPEWHELPLPELLALIHQAVPVPRRERAPVASSAVAAVDIAAAGSAYAATADAEALRQALREGQRTFLTPGGKSWTVRLHERLGATGEPETVLRFTCGNIVLDLRPWPQDWLAFPPERLAAIALDAEPPIAPRGPRHRPRRRREDRAL